MVEMRITKEKERLEKERERIRKEEEVKADEKVRKEEEARRQEEEAERQKQEAAEQQAIKEQDAEIELPATDTVITDNTETAAPAPVVDNARITTQQPATTVRRMSRKKPTKLEIITHLANYYETTNDVVVGWLREMDFS